MRTNEVKKAKKENEAAVEMVKGVCLFCGQVSMVEARIDFTQEEINEVATEQCGCEASNGYRTKKERKETAMQQIAEQFRELEAGRRVILEKLADEIIECRIKKATVDITGRMKCTVKVTSDGTVKIQKKITETSETEA